MVNSGGAGIDWGGGFRVPTSYSEILKSGVFYSVVTNDPCIGRIRVLVNFRNLQKKL